MNYNVITVSQCIIGDGMIGSVDCSETMFSSPVGHLALSHEAANPGAILILICHQSVINLTR